MSDSKFVSHADYWKDRAERAEAKLAELEKQEPAYFVDEQGLLRKYTSRDFNQCNYGGLQRLYARPVPAEKGIVTVTTNDAGRWVMVSRQDEDHRILSVIWEAKDVPTEPVTVAFGKRGKNMFFKIGNQSFLLDYKPEEQAEFDFMKEMLLSAFYRITQGVKTEIQPVNARLLEAIKRLSFCAQTTGGTAGRDEGLCAAIGEAEKAIAAAEAQQKRPSA